MRKEIKRERRRTKICEREWKRKKRGGYFEKGERERRARKREKTHVERESKIE